MNEICKKENAPEPEIKIRENYFYVTFRQSYEYLNFVTKEKTEAGLTGKWSEKWYEKWYEKGLTKREIEIITEIKKNPKISIKKLSETIDINPSAVQKHLEKLKKKGVLKRISHAKGGHWEIKEDDIKDK